MKKILSFISIIVCLSSSYAKASPEELQELPLTKPWDASRKDNTLVQEFTVPHGIFNPVIGAKFSIVFNDASGERSMSRFQELEKFTGDGSGRFVTKESADSDNPVDVPRLTPEEEKALANGQVVTQHGLPYEGVSIFSKKGAGTIIPVHIVIEELGGEIPKTIRDQVINTKGIYAGLTREITYQKLEPGIYKLTLTPMQNIALPEDVSTSLIITAMYKYTF